MQTSQFHLDSVTIKLAFLTRERRNRNRRYKRVTATFVERKKDELIREESSEGKEYTMACFQELSHYSPAATEKNNEIFYNGI
jgi:hypothetical protein